MKLELTPQEEKAVSAQVSAFLDNTLALEADFRRCGRSVDLNEWKSLRTIDDFHIFRQHEAKNGTGLPQVLVAGTLEGELEDFMYGVYDGDEFSWRLRSAYINDRFADEKLLATLASPTHEDPFRFLGIKWLATESPVSMGNGIQKRDNLLVEAIGMATDKHGEPYGYYIMDDFAHPSVPPRPDLGIIRFKFSVCCVVRQFSPDRVCVYVRSDVNFGGNMPVEMNMFIASHSLTSLAGTIETSYNKKLAWLIARQQPKSHEADETVSECYTCKRKQLEDLGRNLVACPVCRHSFCSMCLVERKLVVDLTARNPTLTVLPFCFACVLEAKQLSPMDVARPQRRMSIP
ncbi:hypothetical protein Poli38472_014178 [Pythium oligandrum]|uniref:RING-type domain-containing protein n=1 Tax=Pythium oligandrum TaxID=41045 RepID=A0A8K1CJW3_PYTOL|nr:hypothetical protein Poli38472_014178 [Pythium oligandrum]|eukprot:TMW64061.1 hypothetical protein Poli38472_014178 [Pythium oligandrum]